MTQLFLDCDGVLANFDKRAIELFSMPSQDFEDIHGSKKFWEIIQNDDEFFYNLHPMPDAHHLWEFCCPHDPIILTGCPKGNWAQPQKVRWAKKTFSTNRIITCASKDKKLHGKPGDILVDDLLKYRHLWEEMGGIFVHHTDTKNTIKELEKLL